MNRGFGSTKNKPSGINVTYPIITSHAERIQSLENLDALIRYLYIPIFELFETPLTFSMSCAPTRLSLIAEVVVIGV